MTSLSVTSHPVGMLLPIMLIGTLSTTNMVRKKAREGMKDGKVLIHLGFQSKVFPGPLTNLSAWVGFCTASLQQGVKYQL
jgi:hypothetical protein